MFGRSKKDEFQQLAESRERTLRSYSMLMRSIAEQYGDKSLPATGIVDPVIAEAMLRGVLSNVGAKSPVDVEPGVETRELPASICRIELAGPLPIKIVRGNSATVRLSCSDKSYLANVITEVRSDTLRIGLKAMSFVSTNGNRVIQNINAPVVGGVSGGSIQINGSNNLVVGRAGSAACPVLDFSVQVELPQVTAVTVEGSGEVDFHDVDAEDFDIAISGSGNVRLKGTVESLYATVSGSGDVSTADLVARKARLQVTGSGAIEVSVLDSVDAGVTGSGDIRVHGKPSKRSVRVTGSGDIDFA